MKVTIMLTGDLVKPRLRTRNGRVWVDNLDVEDATARATAAEVMALFEDHHMQPVEVWEAALTAYEGTRTDYEVIRGLAKVLTDNATMHPLDIPFDPSDLRAYLFERGPVFGRRMLFKPEMRADLLGQAAEAFAVDGAIIEAALFADRPAEYLITDVGGPWTPDTLIARYNLELARGVLYWARRMEVDLYGGYKDFWRYLKLFKLMFWATPHTGEEGYHVLLDGPISPFVSSTTRYGRQFAAFLPALLLTPNWRMEAEVKIRGDMLRYTLTHQAELPSVFKASGEFDSKMEANFAAEFHEKFGDERSGWTLTREDRVVLLGDTVFIPDFTLTHDDGRQAVIELLGFWHPDYLRRKLSKVRQAAMDNLILLVYESINLSADRLQNVPAQVVRFVRKPILKEVMAAVETYAI